jgi:hypothetical protein
MNSKLNERGQALILIVFAAIALFGFAALAIDGSRVFSDRRHAQNAADTAVLAAALAQVRGNDYTAAAVQRAESNGFNVGNSTVEVHKCSEAGLNPPCEGLPPGADATQYIQVVIRMSTPTTFARILGRDQVPTVVSAIARAVGGSSPVSFQSPAISAMSPTDEKAFWGNGNFTLDIMNSGVFVNSINPCALVTSGASGTYEVDTSYDVVGEYCWSGQPTLQPSEALNEDANQIPYPPAINIPKPTFNCAGLPDTNASWGGTSWEVPPGNHPAPQPIPGGTIVFKSGTHCFPNGFSVGGSSNVAVENNTNFLISGGEFHMSGNSGMTCNNLLVHVEGGTGMRLNGNGTYNCAGVTFYMSTGNVTWNGNSSNIFSAPTGGTYKGLLLYLPYGNDLPVTVSGNAFSEFTGSIIAVSSPIHLQGNPQTLALSTKIIGYTVQFSGNGIFEIKYDPSQQYAQGEPTMIQLTK